MDSRTRTGGTRARVNVGRRIGSVGLGAWLLIGVFVAPDTAAAQAAAPWVQFTVVQVNPDMVDEFMAVQRELTARAKDADVPWRSVSRTAVFGDTYRFLIATPVQTLASLDDAETADPELAALITRVRQCITSRQSYALRTLPDIDNPLPANEQPDLMVVSVARIAPGREQDYVRLMASDFLPHFEAAGIHYTTGALAFGGEAGYIHLFHVGDFAALDAGSPVVAALGPDAAQKVTAKFAGIVTSSELWLTRLLPELSYGR